MIPKLPHNNHKPEGRAIFAVSSVLALMFLFIGCEAEEDYQGFSEKTLLEKIQFLEVHPEKEWAYGTLITSHAYDDDVVKLSDANAARWESILAREILRKPDLSLFSHYLDLTGEKGLNPSDAVKGVMEQLYFESATRDFDYENYLKAYPHGSFVSEANGRIMQIQVAFARDADSVWVLRGFIKRFPNSPHLTELKERIRWLESHQAKLSFSVSDQVVIDDNGVISLEVSIEEHSGDLVAHIDGGLRFFNQGGDQFGYWIRSDATRALENSLKRVRVSADKSWQKTLTIPWESGKFGYSFCGGRIELFWQGQDTGGHRIDETLSTKLVCGSLSAVGDLPVHVKTDDKVLQQLVGEWSLDAQAVGKVLRAGAALQRKWCGAGWSDTEIKERTNFILSQHSEQNPAVKWSIARQPDSSLTWDSGNAQRSLENCRNIEANLIQCDTTPGIEEGDFVVAVTETSISIMYPLSQTSMNCNPVSEEAGEVWYEAIRLKRR